MVTLTLVASLAFTMQSGSPPDGVDFGRPPPTPDRQGSIGGGSIVPPNLPPAGKPNDDDVQVSSPSNANQNEMVLRVNPLDRAHLIGGANDDRRGNYTCAFYATSDEGKSWSEFLYNPTEHSSAGDPAAAFGPNGEVYYCALEFGSSSSIYVGQSFDGGLSVPSWTRAVGNNRVFEDKQFMVADSTSSPLSGNLYVSWTRFEGGFSSNPIYLIASTDQGQTWTQPTRVSNSNSCQGSCPEIGPNGEVYVAFFDFNSGRIRINVSLDGGLTWGNDIDVGAVDCTLPNAPFRHFCFPTCAVDTSGGPYHGTVYVAYTTFNSNEGGTDIRLFRSADGGQTWQGPREVSDEPNGSSEFFPWMDVDSNGNVNIGYYDRRGSGNDSILSYRVSRSSDSGQTFLASQRASDDRFDPFTYGDGFFIGDYTGVAASDRSVHALWADGRNNTNDAYTSRVQLDLFTGQDGFSASNGSVIDFTINAGPLHQGRPYRLLGSISGTDPGVTFGNGINLPLNPDLFFNITLTQANNAVFGNFAGVLDAQGMAFPQLDTLGPVDPTLVGLQLDFAVLVADGSPMWTSSPTSLLINP